LLHAELLSDISLLYWETAVKRCEAINPSTVPASLKQISHQLTKLPSRSVAALDMRSYYPYIAVSKFTACVFAVFWDVTS